MRQEGPCTGSEPGSQEAVHVPACLLVVLPLPGEECVQASPVTPGENERLVEQDRLPS